MRRRSEREEEEGGNLKEIEGEAEGGGKLGKEDPRVIKDFCPFFDSNF